MPRGFIYLIKKQFQSSYKEISRTNGRGTGGGYPKMLILGAVLNLFLD